MRTKAVKIIAMIAACFMILSMYVFGADITDDEWATVQKAVDSGTITLEDLTNSQATGSTNSIQIIATVNGTKQIISVDRDKGSDLLAKANSASGTTDINKKVDENLPDIEIKPNTDAVEKALENAMGLIETVLGVCIWAIMIGVTIWTVADILFISYPVFNEYIEGQSGNSKGGNIISRLVTREAKEAYKEANSGNGGNVWLIYLKKRIVAIVLIAICLYFVTIGDIGFVIRIVTKLIGGVIRGISDFANS